MENLSPLRNDNHAKWYMQVHRGPIACSWYWSMLFLQYFPPSTAVSLYIHTWHSSLTSVVCSCPRIRPSNHIPSPKCNDWMTDLPAIDRRTATSASGGFHDRYGRHIRLGDMHASADCQPPPDIFFGCAFVSISKSDQLRVSLPNNLLSPTGSTKFLRTIRPTLGQYWFWLILGELWLTVRKLYVANLPHYMPRQWIGAGLKETGAQTNYRAATRFWQFKTSYLPR